MRIHLDGGDDYTEVDSQHVLGLSDSDLGLLAKVAGTPSDLPIVPHTPTKSPTPEFSTWVMNRALGR